MREIALFINGMYETVANEILQAQAEEPDLGLFLQPYSGGRMAMLSNDPPTIEDPMRLFLSITTDLQHIYYTAEIIGWDDKRKLDPAEKGAIEQVINKYQPNEGGLYERGSKDGPLALNLLTVRRMQAFKNPFTVDNLTKDSDRLPLSMNRQRSGGFSYVHNPSQAWVQQRL